MRYCFVLLLTLGIVACSNQARTIPQPDIETPRVGVGCTEDPIGYQDAYKAQQIENEEAKKREEIEALIEECSN